MIPIGCGCGSKNRATASGAQAVSGTYRVMIDGRKVYETTNPDAAGTVAARYDKSSNVVVLKPGEQA